MSGNSTTLRQWLARHNDGDPAAAEEVLRYSQDRLLEAIRERMRAFRRLRPYQDSQDVLVEVQVKLAQDMKAHRYADLTHFVRLAGRLIGHQLIDFTRKYFGPQGAGTKEAQWPPAGSSGSPAAGNIDPADPDLTPAEAGLRTDLDLVIGRLPPEHQEMFNLLYYLRLSREDAGLALGVTRRTVDRRWVAAREALMDAYGASVPD